MDDWKDIKLQLKRMQVLGCSIQLHVHPHWETAVYDGRKWKVNPKGCYKLSDFPEKDAVEIFKKYACFLNDLIDAKVTALS